jgi:hypothetical protein
MTWSVASASLGDCNNVGEPDVGDVALDTENNDAGGCNIDEPDAGDVDEHDVGGGGGSSV